MSILIKNVQHNGNITDVFINENRIELIGDALNEASDITIDGSDKAILPTFHNAHNHAAMTYMRSYADDLELFEWLNEHIWPLEATVTEEDVYNGARLACLEMVKSGTTFFNDMYWHLNGTVRAVEEMGLRAALGPAFIDMNDAKKREESIEQTKELFEQSKSYSDRIIFQLTPHAIYTVSAESFKWCAEFATENELMIHTHLCETEKEVANCLKEHGIRPVEYFKNIGILASNLSAAHCVWLKQDEMELLAEHGVNVLHCPVSNMKLCSGKFRYTDATKAGMKIAIGTDGASSNNNLSMIEEIRIATLLEKHFKGEPTVLPATTAWHLGTRAAAEMYNLNSGVIEEGALADCMLVDLNNERLVPGHNLISDMVYSADSSCIDTVICNGKVLMQARHVENEEEIIAKGREYKEKFKR